MDILRRNFQDYSISLTSIVDVDFQWEKYDGHFRDWRLVTGAPLLPINALA